MKKLWKRGLAVLTGALLCISMGSTGIFAAATDAAAKEIALDDLNISVSVPGWSAVKQSDDFVYIYTMNPDSIPYVIIGQYDFNGDMGRFADMFTEYLYGSYPDLDVDELQEGLKIGNNTFTRVVYNYTISGYQAKDTRLFCPLMGKTYMFGAKEVPALKYEVGEEYLRAVAGSIMSLAGGYSDYGLHVDSGQSLDDYLAYATEEPAQDSSAGSLAVSGTVGGSSQGVASALNKTPKIDFTEAAAGYKGSWVDFQDGFKVYLPTGWNEYVITDDMAKQGTIYLAGDSSGAADAAYIKVAFSESMGYSTMEEIEKALSDAGYTVDRTYSINGIDCVVYGSAEENVSGIMFFHPQTTDYVFSVVGAPAETNAELIAQILSSLSPNP